MEMRGFFALFVCWCYVFFVDELGVACELTMA